MNWLRMYIICFYLFKVYLFDINYFFGGDLYDSFLFWVLVWFLKCIKYEKCDVDYDIFFVLSFLFLRVYGVICVLCLIGWVCCCYL